MTRRKHKTQRDPVQPLAISHTDRLRPWLLAAMMALFVARPLFPSESAANYGDGLTMVMLWIVLAIFWLLGAVGRPIFAIRFGWTDAAVLLLIGWCAVAAVWAVGHATARPAINMLWEWLGMGLCFLAARQLITTAREARAVVAVMIALAVALSVDGLYQYGYELPRMRAEYQANPERLMRDAGLWFPPGSPERQLFESRIGCKEPIATFALTNSLAAFLTPWLIVLTGIVASSLKNRKRLLGFLCCGIPIIVCLMLTKSRSAYIASGVGLLLVWQLSRTAIPIPAAVKRKRSILWIIAGVMASVLLAVALLGGPGGVLLAKATKSFGYRVQYWQSSLHMIADHPIVGCGPGNFQNVYSQYKLPEAAEEVADPHNFLLEIAATAGIPAALAFLAVLGCFARSVVSGRWSVASKSKISDLKSGIPNPQSLIPNPSSSALLFSGAIFGFLLSVPVGMLSAAPQSFVVLLLGLPLAIVAMLLLRGWVRDGRLPTWLPVVGVVVVLIDLSTTGGIAYPSIAGSFWLLLVLGLQNDRPHTLRPIAARILFVAFLALAGMCYFTAYSPVLSCQAQLRLAEREPVPSVEHLEAAAAADPWSAEPWRQLAAVEFERWRQQPNPKTFERFELAIGRSIELAPNSATAWLTAGDFYVQAFSRVEQTDPKMAAFFLNRARSAYGEAVRLYPNNATFRAKLADAYRAEGDISGFRREAKAALRLDNLTPHIDKKLPADTRKRLVQDLDGKL